MDINFDSKWIERPEDFYIAANIYYYDRYDVCGTEEDIEYNDIDSYVEELISEGCTVSHIDYYMVDMLAGNEDKPEELSDSTIKEVKKILSALQLRHSVNIWKRNHPNAYTKNQLYSLF